MSDDVQKFDWDKEIQQARIRMPKTSKMSLEEIIKAIPDDQLREIIDRIGSNYVVMNKTGTSVVQDPGSRLPFFTKIKMRAEQVAKDVGGVTMTFTEAFEILSKRKP